MAPYASSAIVISSIIVGLCFLADFALKQQRAEVLSAYNERRKTFPASEGIPPSCTLDAQALCNPAVNPIQALMNQDPFVRLIMSPIEQSSPESSTMMLDNLFEASAGDEHFLHSPFEQEDAVLGSMLENMMASAMLLSVAAEEMTSSMYYGTRESAAEETFTTMVATLLDLSDTSTGADQYYHDPDQLRKKVCSYGQTVLESENKSTTVDDETRLRLGRRLSEVDQDPESSSLVVIPLYGTEGNELTTFVSTIRIVIFEDVSHDVPPMLDPYFRNEVTKECLWVAYHAGEVSPTCSFTLKALEVSDVADLVENYTYLGNHLFLNFIFGFVAALMLFVTCYSPGCEEEEMDDLELFGNEYHEMSETNMMNGVYTGVPLTTPLRVV